MIYEHGNGVVIEATMTPDTPGRCRRRLEFRILSGHELTEEQWAEASKRIVAEAVSMGIDLIGWGTK